MPFGAHVIEALTNGWWECRACKTRSEPTDETIGNPFAKCSRCGAAGKLQWHPPVLAKEGSVRK
jgi:hypothetical protein